MHFQSTKKGRAFQTLKSKLAFLERIYLEIKSHLLNLRYFLTFDVTNYTFFDLSNINEEHYLHTSLVKKKKMYKSYAR